jgi:hypothetical protein
VPAQIHFNLPLWLTIENFARSEVHLLLYPLRSSHATKSRVGAPVWGTVSPRPPSLACGVGLLDLRQVAPSMRLREKERARPGPSKVPRGPTRRGSTGGFPGDSGSFSKGCLWAPDNTAGPVIVAAGALRI